MVRKRQPKNLVHQIKGVANALCLKWSVDFSTWQEIQRAFQRDADAAQHLERARVLPVPQLHEAIRDTLILWSQTRTIKDLYELWPIHFSNVIKRSWDIANRIRLVVGSPNRNFGESIGDIKKVWEHVALSFHPILTGDDGETYLRTGYENDSEAERWLCVVTRLIVALFDNYWEHGLTSKAPQVHVIWDEDASIVQLIITNATREMIDNKVAFG